MDNKTFIFKRTDKDDNGVEHVNELYKDKNGKLIYIHNGEKLWMCPLARFWNYRLSCQLQYDLGRDVPFESWSCYNNGEYSIMSNPRYMNAKCRCVNAPDNWDECELAKNLKAESEE